MEQNVFNKFYNSGGKKFMAIHPIEVQTFHSKPQTAACLQRTAVKNNLLIKKKLDFNVFIIAE